MPGPTGTPIDWFLEHDLGERNNLIAKEPAKAGELRTLLARWRESVGASVPDAPVAEYPQSAKWDAANAQSGQITGTMVNGKSVTISAAGGFSIADLMAATELALQILEQGLTAPMGRTQARLN